MLMQVAIPDSKQESSQLSSWPSPTLYSCNLTSSTTSTLELQRYFKAWKCGGIIIKYIFVEAATSVNFVNQPAVHIK